MTSLRDSWVRHLVIEHYGGVCDCWGEKRIEFLEIDHINIVTAIQRDIQASTTN